MSNCPFCKAELTQADLDSARCSTCKSTLPPELTGVSGVAGGEAYPMVAPPRESGTADNARTAQTLDSGSFPAAAPKDPQKGTGDAWRVAQTLDSADVPSELADQGARDSDHQPIAQTVDSGTFGATPSELTGGGAADEGRVSQTLDSTSLPAVEHPAEEPLVAQTLDSGSVPHLGPPVQGKKTADQRQVAKTLDTGTLPPARMSAPEDDHGAAVTYDSASYASDLVERVSMAWSGKFQPESTPRTSIKASAHTVEAEANLVIQRRVVRDVKAGAVGQTDYEVLNKLGEGGMGMVLAARQASIDRVVAVKMLKPAGAKDPEARRKFLSEAVVTGDLEHPNIVPIYDLGKDESGALFYSMKRVKGTPWDSVLGKKTFQENLEIFMKVADAVAFAHSRGVVHRDLKPENVMLGDFGEVLVMDWGLALPLGAPRKTAGMAGTPAYMAPEMASGPIERIGIPSDIYLLGAILYEIITGYPPHTGKNVMECLFAAAKNEIRPTDKSGELLSIALKAMATEPKDRYQSVRELQECIRQYQSHLESISLSSRAEEDLRQAQREENYETYARALFGFQEAYNLWEGNARAKDGISRASLAYARSALGKGDYDLAASLLDPGQPEHAQLLAQVREAKRERDARQQRLKTAKRIGVGLMVTVLVVITVAFFWIRAEADRARQAETVAMAERAEAVRQADIARQQTKIAEQKSEEAQRQRSEAVKQKNLAIQQKKLADEQRVLAVAAQKSAVAAQKKEQYGAYVARIGLAAAKIEENAFDRAVALLNECPQALRHWEWGRLMHLCTQDIRSVDAKQPVEAVAFSPDGKRFVTGGWGGTARIWDTDSGRQLLALTTGGQYVFAVAFSPDGKHVATGTDDRPCYAKIWDAQTGALVRSLRGHGDCVLSIAYSKDGKRLLSSSYDNTARLWDLETGESRVFEGHEWWVWCAAFSPDEKRIVTACQDGSAMVWSVETGRAGPPFLGHFGPVYSAAFSPDGKLVATAGYDKRILLWDPDKLRPFDFESLAGAQPGSRPEYESLEGHAAGVRSVRFSPNGKLLVSGGNDNTIRVWDVATRKALKTLRGHGGRVQACVFAPDGQRLLSASHDHTAKIWSLAGYEEVRVFQARLLQGHRDAVLGAAFSPDGRWIASASRDRTAKLWDARTGQEVCQFKEGHEFLATTAVFFPDGKRLLTTAVDNTARIWDLATGTQLLAMEGTGPSAAAALSRDGRRLLTGSHDKTARLWDPDTGSLLARLSGHDCEVTAVAISPDGRWLFTGDAKGTIRLWDAQTGKPRWEAGGHSRGIIAACFLPAGDRVVTASVDHTVGQWDVATGRERVDRVLKHPQAITSMALSPDGRYVLTTCADRVVRLWELESATEVAKLPESPEAVNAAAFSPDGRRAVTTSASGTVRLWDLQTQQEIGAGERGRKPLLDSRAAGSQAWSAIFSPDGTCLLTVGGNEARLWDLKTGREGVSFSPHGSVASVGFSPDGKRLVTGSWDNSARIWNVETGRAELKLEGGHTQYVNQAVFSPDGTKVLTASDDRTAVLWDARTGKLLGKLQGHEHRVRSASFSRDGSRVLTASNDKTARIWDALTGQVIHVLRGHRQAVLCAAFSADGTRVITGGEDNRAKLWDATSGEELPFSLEGHTAAVTSVAFSPDGRRALTGSQDHTSIVWDAQTGKEILTLKGHGQEVTVVAFSPDGRSVLTGSRDGTLILWLAVEWQPQPVAKKPGTG